MTAAPPAPMLTDPPDNDKQVKSPLSQPQRIATVEVICYQCKKNNLLIGVEPGFVDTPEGDQWDAITKPLEQNDWSIQIVDGHRSSFCPECADQTPIQRRFLEAMPTYQSKDCECAKCGNKTLSATYDDGSGWTPNGKILAPIEHIVRQCKRCSFTWAMRCMDAQAKYMSLLPTPDKKEVHKPVSNSSSTPKK